MFYRRLEDEQAEEEEGCLPFEVFDDRDRTLWDRFGFLDGFRLIFATSSASRCCDSSR